MWATYVGGWGQNPSRTRPSNRLHTGSATISNSMASSGDGYYMWDAQSHTNQLFNLWGCETIDGQHVYRVFNDE